MKTIQVLEPMHSGHHTNYLLALIPAIARLQDGGVVGRAVFTVTSRHLQLLQQSGEVARSGKVIEWDGTLVDTPPGPTMKERRVLHESVRDAVHACRADGLVCTSADYDIFQNAMGRLRPDKRHWPARSAAVIHYGLPQGGLSAKENLKRLVYEFAWKLSRWDRLLLVNPLVYESLQKRGKTATGRFELLPDPVPAEVTTPRAQARAALGLPPDGRYIACVGMMDRRKAIPELLAAFATSDLPGQARLLLAGQMEGSYRQLLETRHADLLATGRIVLIDRSLTDQELMWGYAAADLHAVLQYRRLNLSANALKCVAFGRPFVSDQHGFTAMVAERFGAGVTCDVEDVASIAAALVQGLHMSQNFAKTAAMDRLMEFHSYENFANIALASVLGAQASATQGPVRGWAHAYGAGQSVNRVEEKCT